MRRVFSILLSLIASVAVLKGQVTGVVFVDYNLNGTQDINATVASVSEPGMPGVTVAAYDNSNNLVNQATTNSNGAYSLSVQKRKNYRIEIDISGFTDYQSTNLGADNLSSVQFVKAPIADVNFGMFSSYEFNSDWSEILLPRFYDGEYTDHADSGKAALIRFKYNSSGHHFTGTTPTSSYPATDVISFGQVGSTYGLAVQQSTSMAYVGAFYKRFSGFGPAGPDAIYQVDLTTNTLAGIIELDNILSVSNTAGTDLHDFTTNATGKYLDNSGSFDAVGKRAFGDLEISDDQSTLYAVNLYDRKIYAFNITSGVANSTTLSYSWVVPNPCGISDTTRPFGLAYHNGKLYVGMVCENSLQANVYSFVPNSSSPSFTNEVTIDLSYDRQPLSYLDQTQNTHLGNDITADWSTWISQPTLSLRGVQFPIISGPDYGLPQAMLSDIEFDDGDNMILGFRDRFGDQTSYSQYYDTMGGTMFSPVAGGDLLRVCFNGSSYVLESGTSGNCQCNSMGTSNSGPGGYEYYHWDVFNYYSTWDPNDAVFPGFSSYHWETTMGGLVQVKGKTEVVTTSIDPFDDYGNGVIKFENHTGSRQNIESSADCFGNSPCDNSLSGGFTIVETGDYVPMQDHSTFAKGNGLGDMELFNADANVDLGNRVWFDNNSNGIQDAEETGAPNVNVSLYTRNGSLLAESTTNSLGLYSFSSSSSPDANLTWYGSGDDTCVRLNQQYAIVFGKKNVQYDTINKTMAIGIVNYFITTLNSGFGSLADFNDSDVKERSALPANISGFPSVVLTTVPSLIDRHTYDMGLIEVAFLPVQLQVYTADPLNMDALLQWTTSSELNNDKFVVKRSFDGKHFDPFSELKGKGSTAAKSYYSITDYGIGEEHDLVYYRLEQHDINGRITSLGTRIVKFNEPKMFNAKLAMTDNGKQCNLEFSNNTQAIQIEILDVHGKHIASKIVEVDQASVSIDLSGLRSGVYMLKLKAGRLEKIEKLTITN